MHRIASCLLILVALSAATASANVLVAEDDFDHNRGLWGGTGWSDRKWQEAEVFDSNVSVVYNVDQSHSGTSYAEFSWGGGLADLSMTRTVDLSSVDTPELTFYWSSWYTEAGHADLDVEFDNGSGSFVTLDSIPIPTRLNNIEYAPAAYLLPGPMVGTAQRIRFTGLFNSADADRIFIDSIAIHSVPEPAGLTLLAVAGVGLLQGRRRRSRA